MIRNHRVQNEDAGPAKIDRADKPKRSGEVQDMFAVRNRRQARDDVKRVKAPTKARARLSQFLRDQDKKRAETAAEVVDPETGKTREDPVEKRVKRRGLSVVKNKIIGGSDG